jgi:hypothetical protein
MPVGCSVQPADWLVIGRLEESYGFADAARRAYAHIPKPKYRRPNDVWSVAQGRLATLK